MDYKGQAHMLRRHYLDNMEGIIFQRLDVICKDCNLAATAITDLLARAEAAKARVLELETTHRTEICESGYDCVELGQVRKTLEEAEARAKKAERERDAAVQQLEIKIKEQAFANYINPYPPMMPMKEE